MTTKTLRGILWVIASNLVNKIILIIAVGVDERIRKKSNELMRDALFIFSMTQNLKTDLLVSPASHYLENDGVAHTLKRCPKVFHLGRSYVVLVGKRKAKAAQPL